MRRCLRFIPSLLLFVIGLAVGALLSIERRAASFAVGIDRRIKEAEEATPLPMSEAQSRFATREDMLITVMSAVVEEEPLLRAHRLHEIFAHLTLPELRELFERALQVEDRERRGAILSAVLKRWAALDPAGATAAARPYLDRSRKMGFYSAWNSVEAAVSEAWAAAMPEAALAEASASRQSSWMWRIGWRALESLAGGDPVGQLEAIGKLPDTQFRRNLYSNVIRILSDTDPAAAAAHLDLVSDRWQRNQMQADILGKLAKADPAAAIARLAELGPQLTAGTDGIRIVGAVLRDAAKRDPDAAMAVVEKLPEELRSRAVGSVLVGWAGKDPLAALNWATSNGLDVANVRSATYFGPNGAAGWNTLLMAAFETDHAKAFEWLRAQPPSPGRDDLLRDGMWRGATDEKFTLYGMMSPEKQADQVGFLVSAVNRDDPKRAEAWVAGLPPGPSRSAAVQSLVAAQLYKNPGRIDSITEDWAAGPDRQAALAGMASQLRSTDPQRGLSFARQVTDSLSREVAMEGLAWSWLRQDPREARGWINTTSDLSAEQKRVLICQFEEE
jgi:hypothetical protein